MRFDVSGSFFFDRSDYNLITLRAGSVEHQQREASVASDDAEFGIRAH
jgi:hypothetical protein